MSTTVKNQRFLVSIGEIEYMSKAYGSPCRKDRIERDPVWDNWLKKSQEERAKILESYESSSVSVKQKENV
ncbi:MAG: hypothetical protein LBQ52_04935 [Helicobacteraceae bacterium]|nr:hypothetical protein [Helicobacteraceae bacterium]